MEKHYQKKFGNTPAGSPTYGRFHVIVKNNSEKIEFTRTTDLGENEESLEKTSDRMVRIKEKDELKRRIQVRTNGTYDNKKNEAFYTGAVGEAHYGVRTGIGITDIDYIVVEKWDKKIGYELAMNGTYIPVIDREKGEIIFSPEQYDEIRDKMQGLSYYDAGEFKVDKTAYSNQVKEIVNEIFPTGDANYSKSKEEADRKREAITNNIEKSLHENMGLDVKEGISGNITSGFVELIDTGSTGRGTNLPGDGDFDFTMKVDKEIMETPESLEKLRKSLRDVLAIKSDEPESSTLEIGDGLRYKKVKVEGEKEPLDIDITFTNKTENVKYSTDMSVKDRLEGLKKSDPEGYTVTIGNIILAKKMLKAEGLYKKEKSNGASKYGGFGGVGVENWILQNGGSFYKAMDTFLKASDKADNFNEFKEIYPIFDFGENHTYRKNKEGQNYKHDSFIFGVTPSGYEKMKEKFKEFQKELVLIDTSKTKVNMQGLLKNAALNNTIRQSEITHLDEIERLMAMDTKNKEHGVEING